MKQADHERLPHKLYLFYSNHRPEDAPFLETLENLEKTNPNFQLIATMSEILRSKRKWEGETGPIDKAMLSRYVNDLRGPFSISRDHQAWLRRSGKCFWHPVSTRMTSELTNLLDTELKLIFSV